VEWKKDLVLTYFDACGIDLDHLPVALKKSKRSHDHISKFSSSTHLSF